MTSRLGPLPPGDVARPSATVIPHIVGYTLTRLLGRGAMGEVWHAVQHSTHRQVAIKLLDPAMFSSARARDYFAREVELTASLQHPNIARVYDSGLNAGVYYFTMELIDGAPLDKHLAANKLTRRQILEMFAVICRAVQHAHQRGVIHRDLKHSNILVDSDAQPHIVDFGLARAARPAQQADVHRSVIGEVTGTLAYMPPEQAAGDTDRIDTHADVYSLGVILFNILTGQWPHDLEGSYADVQQRKIHLDIRRPRSVCSSIDRELEAVLLKALDRQPERRYGSAGEFAADIENYLAGEPLSARRPTLFYFLARRIRKYRWPVAIGSAALAALIALAIFAVAQIRTERDRTQHLIDFNIRMSQESDLDSLLRLIVTEARTLTNADAASLFICRNGKLEFKVAQNQTLASRLGEAKMQELFTPFTIPISTASVAGYVATNRKLLNIPDVERIDPSLGVKHDSSFDRKNGYHTRSVLTIPMVVGRDEVVGVLQLINRTSAAGNVIPFAADQEGMMSALAAQAAIALRYAQRDAK